MERGLKLHDALATKDLRPFHNKMETCFADMKARVAGEERKSSRPKDLQVGVKRSHLDSHSNCSFFSLSQQYDFAFHFFIDSFAANTLEPCRDTSTPEGREKTELT